MFSYDLDKDPSLSDVVKKEIKQKALGAYPEHKVTLYGTLPGASEPNIVDDNFRSRKGYIEGYAQCYKDYTYSLQKKMEEIREKQVAYDMPAPEEVQKIVNEHFWDML